MFTLARWIDLAVLVLAITLCSMYFFRYRGSQNWPTVEETVEALVRIFPVTGASGPWCGKLSYSYSVGGESYSGEWDTPMLPSRQKVSDFIEKYIPPQSAVVVQYDPKRPEISTLQVDPELGKPDYLTEIKI